jgi:hypothetical protein
MQSSAIYSNLVRTSQETRYVSTTEPLGETVGVYCENHTDHIYCGKNARLRYAKDYGIYSNETCSQSVTQENVDLHSYYPLGLHGVVFSQAQG